MSGHRVGQKRFENKIGITLRDRSAQRRAAAETEVGQRPVHRIAKKIGSIPRPIALRMSGRPENSLRRMPHGVCPGCGEEGPLPPFGDGMCFLCATDGPPGEHTQAGGALDEDADARGDATEEDETREEVAEIFREAGRHGRWVNLRGDIAEEFAEYTSPEGEAARVSLQQTDPSRRSFRYFRATGFGRRSVTEWLIGQHFGKLTVVRRTAQTTKRGDLFECMCLCGRRVLLVPPQIKSNRSCGCLRSGEEHRKRCKVIARRRKNAIKVTHGGISISARDLADSLGVPGKRVVHRLRRGIPLNLALHNGSLTHRCSLCHTAGHNRRCCPTLGDPRKRTSRQPVPRQPHKPHPASDRQRAAAAAVRRRLTDDMIGQRFGKLLVLRRTSQKRGAYDLFECQCSCGSERKVLATAPHIKRGGVKSCGCMLSTTARREQGRVNAQRWAVRVQFRGQTITLNELAALTGTQKNTIRARLKRGFDVETAATMQPERVRRAP